MEKVDTSELKKLYYSISEVSKMFDVNSSLIRFWEKEFDALHLKKASNGRRQFTVKDIDTLNRIYFLVKLKGFTLDGAKKELRKKSFSSESTEIESNETLIIRLESIKNKLLKLKSSSN